MEVKKITVSYQSFVEEIKVSGSPLAKYAEKVMIASGGKDPMSFLPHGKKYSVDFVLAGAVTEFVNMLRIVMLEELPVKAFEYNTGSKKNVITDEYILIPNLKTRISAIRIDQDFDYKNAEASLVIENKTEREIPITSEHIFLHEKGKRSAVLPRQWEACIFLAMLKPLRSIDITLSIDTGSAITCGEIYDNNKYCAISNIRYRQSADQEDTFELGFSTHRNIRPITLMNLLQETLVGRLVAIMDELKRVKREAVLNHKSDVLSIVLHMRDTYKILLHQEYKTIPPAIAKYIYNLTPDNPGIVISDYDRTFETAVIIVQGRDILEVMPEAIRGILVDLRTLDVASKKALK